MINLYNPELEQIILDLKTKYDITDYQIAEITGTTEQVIKNNNDISLH